MENVYQLEVITTRSGLANIATEWQQFVAGNVQGNNVGNDPHHIEVRLDESQVMTPWILILRSNGEIRCIAPFFTNPTRFKLQLSVLTVGSLPMQLMKVFGDQFIVANDEDFRRCYTAVFEAVSEQRSHFGAIYFDQLDDRSPLWNFCCSRYPGGGQYRMFMASTQLEKVHIICFPASHDEFMSSLKPNCRQNLRRRTRKLQNDQNVTLNRFTAPEQVPMFLNRLETVYRDTWQAKTFGYYPRDTASQRRYYSRIAEQGWLRSYILEGDCGPIAYEVGFQYKCVFYGMETGYRQSYSSYGAGSVLTHLMIEDLYRDQPPKIFDFGLGDLEHKRQFSNAEHNAAAIYLVPQNRWRMILAIQQVLNSIERGVRATLTKIKLDQIIRKLLKRRR